MSTDGACMGGTGAATDPVGRVVGLAQDRTGVLPEVS